MVKADPGRPDAGPVASLEALRQTLVAGGVALERWGTGQAKSLENLWEEIATGETRLQAEPLRRVLAGVVQLIIRRGDGRILIEQEQVLEDGRRRARNIPPAEKMLAGETYVDAVRRCLREELRVNPDTAEILTHTHEVQLEQHDSWSYPGLISLYPIHRVEVRVPGLPRRSFRTVEAAEAADGLVREHLWTWKRLPAEPPRARGA